MKWEWLRYTVWATAVFAFTSIISNLASSTLHTSYGMLIPILVGILTGVFLWQTKLKIEAHNEARTTELTQTIATLQDEALSYQDTTAAFHQSEQHLQSLLRLSNQLQHVNTYDEIITALTSEVRVILGYRSAWLYLVDEKHEVASLITYRGENIPTSLNEAFSVNISGDPFLEESLAASHIVVVEDARTDSRTNPQIIQELGSRTIVHVPLCLLDKQLGILGMGTFGDEGIKVPQPDQLDYLSTLANHIAVAVERVQFIEKRRQYERTLRESEERYRLLVESAPLAILVYDNDKIVYANPTAVNIFRAESLDTFLGKSFLEFIHPDSLALVQSRRQQLAAGERLEPVEERVIRFDGQVCDIEVHTSPIMYQGRTAVLAMVKDITVAKVMEAENKRLLAETAEYLQREEHLNEIARIISGTLKLPALASNIVHLATQLVDAEKGALALIDETGESLTYTYFCNLPPNFTSSARPKGQGIAWLTILTNQAIHLGDYSTHPQAQPEWIHMGIRAVMSIPVITQDTCLGTLLLCNTTEGKLFSERDLANAKSVGRQAGVAIHNARLYATEHERVEALAKTLAQQEELNRLMTGFLQNTSHELRTPLAIAMGYIDLIAEDISGELTVNQKEMVVIAQRRLHSLSQIVADLTTLSLFDEHLPVQFELVNLVELVEKVATDFHLLAKKASLSLQTDVGTIPLVPGNASLLWQMLDNLLSNAIKFTHSGGQVNVRLFQDNAHVTLEIADTGIGITPAQMNRIFERFYQADSSASRTYGGTGLGLSLVKEIVGVHGGDIQVESEVKKGSTFRILLPLA
ncbi:MAG: GAF domain-containing protein [Ardenticatenaceae bacterium]|nr:GAF domain-containing protein [Ardenticatenaceae bacterium]MCB9003396.1 GAF domain-containing protein [Ardenticatenaceae bacterium]